MGGWPGYGAHGYVNETPVTLLLSLIFTGLHKVTPTLLHIAKIAFLVKHQAHTTDLQ